MGGWSRRYHWCGCPNSLSHPTACSNAWSRTLPAAAPFPIEAVGPSIPEDAPRALLAAAASMLDKLELTLLMDALALFVLISTTSSSLL